MKKQRKYWIRWYRLTCIPFLILLILVMPVTKAIVGKTYGATATIVPLVIAAAPFIGRMVESSLKEVEKGVIEAAQSMGAGTGTIFGYSAMAGVIGGGGLVDRRRISAN